MASGGDPVAAARAALADVNITDFEMRNTLGTSPPLTIRVPERWISLQSTPPSLRSILQGYRKLNAVWIGTGTFGRVRLCTLQGQVYAMKILQKSEVIMWTSIEHQVPGRVALSLFLTILLLFHHGSANGLCCSYFLPATLFDQNIGPRCVIPGTHSCDGLFARIAMPDPDFYCAAPGYPAQAGGAHLFRACDPCEHQPSVNCHPVSHHPSIPLQWSSMPNPA